MLPIRHFHYRMFYTRLFDYLFQLFGNTIFQPISAAQITNLGGDITHNNHAKTQFNGKSSRTRLFIPAMTDRAMRWV